MAKLENDLKIVTVKLYLKPNRKTMVISEKIAKALNICLGNSLSAEPYEAAEITAVENIPNWRERNGRNS